MSGTMTLPLDLPAASAPDDTRLALLLQAVDAGFWEWDLASGLVAVTGRFAELFRLDGAGTRPVGAVFAAVGDADLEGLQAAFADLFARRTDRLRHECAIRMPPGELRWVRLRGQVTAWTAAGEPLQAVGLAIDVSDDRRRADSLRTTHKLDAIGALAAGVAHEINTPLQFVSHNLEFLASQCAAVASGPGAAAGDPADVRHELAGAIAESIDGIDRVTRIVRALKEFSHHGRSAQDRVDLNQMIENAVTLTRHEWKLVATVERQLAPGLPPVAIAAHECGQVLVNLLVNAAHAVHAATRPGGRGRIDVATRLVDGAIEIQVRDTGVGMPPEVQARLFEPFFTTKGVGRGTGQGLSTARAIVERHGGTIGFESAPGRGTTFVVRLPMTGPAGGRE
jgi:signal transduction histidine kinase